MNPAGLLAALGLIAAVSLSSCGGGDEPGAGTSDADAESAITRDDDSESSSTPTQEYRRLTKVDLEAALVSVSDLPPGYAEQPAYKDAGKGDSYCGFKPPQPKLKVRRDFLKGGGLTTHLLSFSIGQYDSEAGAEDYLDEFTKQLESCTSETVDGEKIKYAVMSVPQVGDRAMGLRTEGEIFTLIADLAQVGPVVIIVGGGGPTSLEVDVINEYFEKQAEKYVEAAQE